MKEISNQSSLQLLCEVFWRFWTFWCRLFDYCITSCGEYLLSSFLSSFFSLVSSVFFLLSSFFFLVSSVFVLFFLFLLLSSLRGFILMEEILFLSYSLFLDIFFPFFIQGVHEKETLNYPIFFLVTLRLEWHDGSFFGCCQVFFFRGGRVFFPCPALHLLTCYGVLGF